jgi:hypothetical protein
MNDELDSRLRDALRPVEPRKEFSAQLLARVAAAAPGPVAPAPARAPRRSGPRSSPWWLAAGLAASLLIAIGVQHHRSELDQRERGLEARRQVIEALRVTNQKLELAYRVVRSESSETVGENSST